RRRWALRRGGGGSRSRSSALGDRPGRWLGRPWARSRTRSGLREPWEPAGRSRRAAHPRPGAAESCGRGHAPPGEALPETAAPLAPAAAVAFGAAPPEPSSDRILVPLGEPSPVQGSQPGPALKTPLFPSVIGWKPPPEATLEYSSGLRK